MDYLKVAALDVTLLVTSVRALGMRGDAESTDERRTRKRWASDLRRAVDSYLKTLWRVDDARFDASALRRCRVAAECEMKDTLHSQVRIKAALEGQAQSLAGYVTARNDLWRIAHVVVQLRGARRMLEQRAHESGASSRRSPGRRLQRRLRRAMRDYSRSFMRNAEPGLAITMARQSVLERLDSRCLASADQLARASADAQVVHRLITDGVVRPLRALAEDWVPKPSRQESP